MYKDEIPSNLSESSSSGMVLENIEEVGTGNSLLSEALLSLDEINSSKCIPIGDGKVKCLICDRELKRDSWKRHISSVHSNNRPYSCNMCNTTFKVSENISPYGPPKLGSYPQREFHSMFCSACPRHVQT